MPDIYITNETAKLKSVILGTPLSMGGVPDISEAYDPKSKEHIRNNTFPTQESVTSEMNGFLKALLDNGIKVHQPKPIEDYNQIFSRDIGCVIEDKFLISNIISERSREIEAISHIMNEIPEEKVIQAPQNVRFEGGDIMPHNEFIFVGYSKKNDFDTYKVSRTNQAGVDFIKVLFPHKHIKSFELHKSDEDPKENALHLDCCFQPLGKGHALIHKNGFKNEEEFQWLLNHFGEENCFLISKDQMYNMGCNIFSIAPDHVISDIRFEKINDWLKEKGYKVTPVKYGEISKMEGLLRCSTLPLLREDS